MRFKVPEGVSSVAHRGMTAVAVDGFVEIPTALFEDIADLSGFGLVHVPDAPPAAPVAPDVDPDVDAKAAKEAIAVKLEALGVKPDRRKSLESLEALLKQTEITGVA
jgi:hypothetical protein